MKIYQVTVTQVSQARPAYYNVLVDGLPIAEIRSSLGYLFGDKFKEDLFSNAYNVADRVISDRDFDYGRSGTSAQLFKINVSY